MFLLLSCKKLVSSSSLLPHLSPSFPLVLHHQRNLHPKKASIQSTLLLTSTLRMRTGSSGASFFPVLLLSIAWTTSAPLTTRPKTVCLPSSQGVGTVVMKNCEPLVCGPALAIERVNGRSCLGTPGALPPNSSEKLRPQMEVPPVPSPSGQPPVLILILFVKSVEEKGEEASQKTRWKRKRDGRRKTLFLKPLWIKKNPKTKHLEKRKEKALTLDHKPLDDSVEGQVVIIAVPAVRGEVLDGLGRVIRE